jgi:ArsR family transcriptional regulator
VDRLIQAIIPKRDVDKSERRFYNDYRLLCKYVHTNNRRTMRSLIKATKALSDETRLRILNLLLERECCVCEVMQALDISQSRASRGLSALYDVGFLKLRKEGLWCFYSINKADEFCAELVDLVGKALQGNRLLEEDRERLQKAEPRGPRCVVQPADL